MMGGYERIFGGSCADAFADLLGCPALEYNLLDGLSQHHMESTRGEAREAKGSRVKRANRI